MVVGRERSFVGADSGDRRSLIVRRSSRQAQPELGCVQVEIFLERHVFFESEMKWVSGDGIFLWVSVMDFLGNQTESAESEWKVESGKTNEMKCVLSQITLKGIL